MERSPFGAAARLFMALAMTAALLVPHTTQAQDKPPLLVLAAASLKNALDEAATAWTKESGVEVRSSYAATSALAKQMEEGAPADLFLSADLRWMDHVEMLNLIRSNTRVSLLGNSLVLVAPKDWKGSDVTISEKLDLAKLIGEGRLAVAGVESVPAGRYAKAALTKLGLWDSVEKKLAEAENVRSALAFVSRGEAPFGIVYSTDAAADKGVKIVGTFPEGSHPPIIYPVGVLANSRNPQAEPFWKYLSSPAARNIFESHGFTIVAPASST